MKIQFKFYLYFILATLLPIIAIFLWQDYLFLSIIIIFLFIALYFLIRNDFFKPLDGISKWLVNYQRQNNDMPIKNSFIQIANAIDHLNDENQNLYDDMEMVLNKQIQRLNKKTASLEILYGVTEKINKINDKKQLFKQFLAIFIDMTNASGGIARENINGNLKLIVQQNANITDLEVADKSPCVLAEGVQFSIYDCPSCTKFQNNIGTVFIPLSYKGENLGAFALFFAKKPPSLAYDERLLIQAIADNISTYLDKLKQLEKSNLKKIAEEKLYLSQEIHDSLAQTIYSMNLQISVLQDLVTNENQLAQDKIISLQNNVKQANHELRSLIDNFREPNNLQNSEKLVQQLIADFKQETGIKVYSLIDNIQLSNKKKQQIMRILSEALTNIKKHAKAKNVRIMYNNSQLLIEDDGIGFVNKKNHQIDHIGIKIMRERAQRFGAKFYLQSEPNEGTLIIINYEL